MFNRTIPLLFMSVLMTWACSEDSSDSETSFTKIYDTQRSDATYYPIDLVETDSGYIVLSGEDIDNSAFMGVQLIQLDVDGNYILENKLPGDHVIPIGEFIKIDDMHYFFTMNPTSTAAQLVRMGNNPSSAEILTLSGGAQFPLAANSTSDGQLMLLSYDPDAGQTVLSIFSTDGVLQQGTGYSIGAGNDGDAIVDMILEHYTDPERSALPFFCGEVGIGNYYFNGFYNFSLSLVFTDLSSTPTGVIQGQGSSGGVTAAMPTTTNSFSIFGYQFNENFILPNLAIDMNATSSSVDYMNDNVTIAFSEFISRTSAVIKSFNLNGIDYSIFAGETQARQVALYFYDNSTGNLSGIYNVGHINPYTLGSIKVDDENNLLVLGTTFISGRFERLFLTKISESEIKSTVE